MKKSIFLAALVLVSAGCFAQKANLSKARNLCEAETPEFNAARDAVKEALQNEETKDLPNAWYVAGYIGYKEFEAMQLNRQLGRGVDALKWGDVVMESLNYWNKAYELTLTPTSYDKKGNPKFDTRTPNQILPKIHEYYNSAVLMSAGFQAYEDNNPSAAYDYIMAHINIPELPIMVSKPEEQARLLRDTSYYTCLYYAGRFAYEAERFQEAIATLDRMNSEHANANALRKEIIYANEYIYQIYLEQQDTINAIESIKNSINLFPEEPWFVQNLINLYVNSGQEGKAIEYLDLAIQREPNVAQYYNSKGSVLARSGKFEEAFVAFDQAIALEPNNPIFLSSLGFAYIDLGNKINDDAAYLDAKAYEKEKVKVDEAFTNSMNYFKKAYELDPENGEYKRYLRQLYYRLGMYDEYNALAD